MVYINEVCKETKDDQSTTLELTTTTQQFLIKTGYYLL